MVKKILGVYGIWIFLCLLSQGLYAKKTATPEATTDETTTVVHVEDFSTVISPNISNEDIGINDTVITGDPEPQPGEFTTTEANSSLNDSSHPNGISTPTAKPEENACSRKPCLNEGVCSPDPVHPGYLYSCNCSKGFSGQRCQVVDQCILSKEGEVCQGGSCVFTEDRESKHCRCFFGTVWDEKKKRCSEPRPPCVPNPCLHGGKCKEQGDGYRCICPKGYDGSDCSTQNLCGQDDNCNNGTCIHDEYQKAKYCVCNSGFYFNLDTRQCQAIVTPCLPNPCENGGTCEALSSSEFNCSCSSRYVGKTCSILDECGEECKHGHCVENTISQSCECDKGYFLDEFTLTCKEVLTPCDIEPCGSGLCLPLPPNGYNCTCGEGYEGPQCDDLDYCVMYGGLDFCTDAECTNKMYWDIEKETFYCACPEGQQFHYVLRSCIDIDLCPLMQCNENEECKNSHCDCKEFYNWNNSTGKCEPHKCPSNPCPVDVLTCIEGSGIENYMCACKTGEAFNGTHCKSEAKCVFPSLNECEQVCKALKDGYSCSCLEDFTLNDDNRTCTYVGNATCSNKTCETCLKTEDGEICVCPPGFIEKGGKCLDLCSAGEMPKGFCPNNVCESTSTGFRCKCTGKYALSADQVTCTVRRPCMQSEVGWKECTARNGVCIEDWSRYDGYKCACADGLVETEGGMCQDICSIEEHRKHCAVLGAECDVSEKGKATCKCPPYFYPFEDGKFCNRPAPMSYLWNIPLNPAVYKRVESMPMKMAREMEYTMDYKKVEKEARQSLESLVPGFLHLNVLVCRENRGTLLCKIEVQFASTTEEEYLKRLVFPEICAPTEKYPSSCIIPPALVLQKEQVRRLVSFKKTDPCDQDIKTVLCAPETFCKSSVDPPSFNCSCKQGFESWKREYPFGNTLSMTDSCRDVDECSAGNPCPLNMKCRNTYSSYECFCNTGYRLDKETSPDKCVEICNPNPCVHGACTGIGEHEFQCRCDAGFSGTLCNLQDENFKRARTNTIVVGAVLGGFLLVTLILSYAYISKLKKKKSMDDPCRMLYGTEMTERRNADSGAINNAYQRE